jgi:hypothetical protein
MSLREQGGAAEQAMMTLLSCMHWRQLLLGKLSAVAAVTRLLLLPLPPLLHAAELHAFTHLGATYTAMQCMAVITVRRIRQVTAFLMVAPRLGISFVSKLSSGRGSDLA